MTEAYGIRLTKASNFDGTSPIALTRDNFAVSGGRMYTATVPDPGGIIPADIFGFFAPEATKLVGIAFTSYNPMSRAALLDTAGRKREEFPLTTALQYVVMHPTDRLAILTKDSSLVGVGPIELTLVVNEMSESDHMLWAQVHPPMPHHTRLRIVRDSGAAFVPNPTGSPWIPDFVWDQTTNVLVAHDDLGTGPIPVPALCPHPKHYGCFVSVRYGGSNNNGKLRIVDPVTRRTWIAHNNLADVRWSRAQYVSHDDMIALEATLIPVGSRLVCDIEVVRVEPGDRLRGRYANNL